MPFYFFYKCFATFLQLFSAFSLKATKIHRKLEKEEVLGGYQEVLVVSTQYVKK